jgi:hypothetical protein
VDNIHLNREGDNNEHLDDLIRGSVDSLDRRFRCVPRSGRAYSPVVSVCCDLSDLALRLGRTDGLNQTHREQIGEVLTASSLLATLSSGDTK